MIESLKRDKKDHLSRVSMLQHTPRVYQRRLELQKIVAPARNGKREMRKVAQNEASLNMMKHQALK